MALDLTELFTVNPRQRALRSENRQAELRAQRAAAMAAQTGAVNPAAMARLQALAQAEQRAAGASRMAAARVGDELGKTQAYINLVGGLSSLVGSIGGMASGGGGGGGGVAQSAMPFIQGPVNAAQREADAGRVQTRGDSSLRPGDAGGIAGRRADALSRAASNMRDGAESLPAAPVQGKVNPAPTTDPNSAISRAVQSNVDFSRSNLGTMAIDEDEAARLAGLRAASDIRTGFRPTTVLRAPGPAGNAR